MKIKITITLYVVIVLVISGCYSQSSNVVSRTVEEAHPTINPEVVIYNFSVDSTVAFVKLLNNELLYRNDSARFLANIRINLFIQTAVTSSNFIDSTSLTFSIEKSDDSYSYMVARLFFKKPEPEQLVYKFEVVDLNRTTKSKKLVYGSNNGNQSANSFITILSGNSFPLFSATVAATDSFHIYNYVLQTDSVYLRYYKRNYLLAAPPHVENPTIHFSYVADSVARIAINDFGLNAFAKKGIYHLQVDTMIKTGYTLFNFGDEYPVVTKAEQMIGPIRYLTTKNEYAKITSVQNTIDAIESFWVERAGNQTQARKLISDYYKRVEFANKNFTSYIEGWKTDRGMISIIFGKPDYLEYKDKQEVWTYLTSNEGQPLEFVFSKINNPFTENDFILIRSQRYEMPWFSAVDSWRNGREVGK